MGSFKDLGKKPKQVWIPFRVVSYIIKLIRRFIDKDK
jgi:hypothetical protein